MCLVQVDVHIAKEGEEARREAEAALAALAAQHAADYEMREAEAAALEAEAAQRRGKTRKGKSKYTAATPQLELASQSSSQEAV